MDAELAREVAIAGHWRAADPTADIHVTDFDLKNLCVWTVTPGDSGRWREWGVKVSPMSDEMFGEINVRLQDGGLQPVGTNVGKTGNGKDLVVLAYVRRERRGGREWLIHFDLPLPEGI